MYHTLFWALWMYHMSFQPHNPYGVFLVLSHFTDGQTEALRGHTVLVQQDLRACAHILTKWSCLIKRRVETEGPCSYQSISRSLKGIFRKKQKKVWKTERKPLTDGSWCDHPDLRLLAAPIGSMEGMKSPQTEALVLTGPPSALWPWFFHL